MLIFAVCMFMLGVVSAPDTSHIGQSASPVSLKSVQIGTLPSHR